MRGLSVLIIASLVTSACEDELARDASRAADRAKRASARLEHERQDLTAMVARHDDVSHQVIEVAREATAFAEAENDFEYFRLLRVQSLRGEHVAIAIQPLLIQTISTAMPPMLPTPRARLDENLVIFRQRLRQTREAIDRLQYATPSEWDDLEGEVAQAMAGLFIARDASWKALQGKTESRPAS